MKLLKSIEKAKQQRQQAIRKASTEVSLTENEFNRQKWIPPVYSESKSIELDFEKLAENRCISVFPDVPEAESYKILRTNIQQRANENKWNTIMVTSVHPGEGKTLTAINLALSFAKEFNNTVLLVDCDFKRQSVHQYLKFSSEKGIVDYLINNCQLKDLIVSPNIEKMTVISGGKTISNSSELLNSPKMKALVKEVKNRYNDRYVFFDVPPLLYAADSIAFAPLVDCIIMVVQQGRTSMQEIKQALEMIPSEKFMGFVFNRQKELKHGYYYY